MDTRLNAVVTGRMDVLPETMVLRVSPEGWELPGFTPGQFAVLGLPGSAPRVPYSEPEDPEPDPEGLIKRAYSVASSSREREYFEFYVTLVRSGELTPRLFALAVGDRLWLSTKTSGIFTLADVPAEIGNIVLVATGTGLAPYMSMLRSEFVCNSGRRYAVLHGARHSWDLGYRSELAAMARLCGNFTYIASVSRPDDEPVDWAGRCGYVQDLWSGGLIEEAWGFRPSPGDTHVFLCGNPAMVDCMATELASVGFSEHTSKSPGQVHAERYW